MATVHTDVEVAGRVVRVSNPDKLFFAARGETKLDLIRYYMAVGEGALRGVRERPTVLKRYPNGAGGDFFYQKRVPAPRPEWLETVTVHFPSGRSAEELCPDGRGPPRLGRQPRVPGLKPLGRPTRGPRPPG